MDSDVKAAVCVGVCMCVCVCVVQLCWRWPSPGQRRDQPHSSVATTEQTYHNGASKHTCVCRRVCVCVVMTASYIAAEHKPEREKSDLPTPNTLRFVSETTETNRQRETIEITPFRVVHLEGRATFAE